MRKALTSSLTPILILMCLVASVTTPSLAQTQATESQDKPQVYVFGTGTLNYAIGIRDVHDETMEVAKQFGSNCGEVVVTMDRSKADYAVILNRESKRKRGLIRNNSQIMVVNRAGAMVMDNNTHLVSSAAHDACSGLLRDWRLHGRIKSDGSSFIQSAAPLTPGGTAPVLPASLPFDMARVPSSRT
jgi:hypothetical protein